MREAFGLNVPSCSKEHASTQLWHPVHLSGWIISIILMRFAFPLRPTFEACDITCSPPAANAASASHDFIVATLQRGPEKSLMQIKFGPQAAVGCPARGNHRIRSGNARAGRARMAADA
jgi:hypothetical protein